LTESGKQPPTIKERTFPDALHLTTQYQQLSNYRSDGRHR